jgi:hypothetical protein
MTRDALTVATKAHQRLLMLIRIMTTRKRRSLQKSESLWTEETAY